MKIKKEKEGERERERETHITADGDFLSSLPVCYTFHLYTPEQILAFLMLECLVQTFVVGTVPMLVDVYTCICMAIMLYGTMVK